ncbi:MAG: hypothetical protein Q4Q31_00015 [Bacillota bacterium]|nr:hypothetical protein [Bacillota bacterium]
MKKTTLGKTTAAMLTTIMMLNGSPMVSAYSGTIEGEKTTTFEKYLVMDKDANVPNASFTYSISAGTPTNDILAGVDANKVTMEGVDTETANTITYKPNDTTSSDANNKIKNFNSSTQKYALKKATLDFSQCQFQQPGIYRYVLTELGVNQAITNDEATTRTIDVYVENAEGNSLKIAGYVLHSGTGSNKSQGYTNNYDTSDLTFRKEVSGNQASHDKYFKFTVNITGAKANTVYNVDLTNADSTVNGHTNPTTLTVGTNGTVSADYYLKHGQEIKVEGIAKDSKYNVTEDNDGYSSKAASVENYNDPTSGTIVSSDLKTSYLNEKTGTIPTGVIISVAPFAAITLFAVAGMVTIKMSKKRKTNED